MALRIKDTSVIWTTINSPKPSNIEICIYLTSELRTPLYNFVLWTLDPAPNGYIAWLANSIIRSRPCPPPIPPRAIASSSAAVPHGSSWRWLVYETRIPDIEISPSVRLSLGLLLLVWVVTMVQVNPANWWVWLAKLCILINQPPN